MPIYEYRCDNCGHELETIQKVSEAPLITCPACQHDALRKRVSAAAFRLKGGGWYETDFKSDRKRNVAGEEKAASDGKSESAGGKDGAGKDGSSKDGSSKDGASRESGGKAADGAAGKGGKSSSSGDGGKAGGSGNGGTSKSKAAE